MNRYAFSLLEVIVALSILGFCLVAVLGLMPMGLQDYRCASASDPAALLLESIEGDLGSACARGLEVSDHYGLKLPSPGEPTECEFFLDGDGERTEVVDPRTRWRVKLRMRSDTAVVFGHLSIWWPAQANESAESAETFLALVKQ